MTRAEQLLAEALEINPNLSVAHEAMGMLRRAQNRFAESQIEFETAITHASTKFPARMRAIPTLASNPQDPNAGHMLGALGMCHLLLGHVDQAIDLITKARARNPRSWFLYLYLAGALGLKGDLERAKAVLAESIKLKPEVNSIDPNNARAFHHLGQGLMYLGQPAAGIPQIEKAIRLTCPTPIPKSLGGL
jgi:tetratricopeptide (TPR) repeat protein